MAHCENKSHLERNRLQLQPGTKELRHKTLHFVGFQAITLWRISFQFPSLLTTSYINLVKFPLKAEPGAFTWEFCFSFNQYFWP